MLQKLIVLSLLSFLFVACAQKKDAQSFEKVLEAETGHSHSIAKLYTEKGNFAVYKDEVTGEFKAYNMDKWDRETMTTVAQFMANGTTDGVDVVRNLAKSSVWVVDGYWESIYRTEYGYDEYYDEDCDCYETERYSYEVYVGERYVDTSHWYTYYSGNGFRFENTSSGSKDLETVAALKEEAAEKFIAFKLKSEFSLSTNRAEELAKLANRYQKLENSRELTSPEKDKFAMEALGVSMNQVESALKAKAEGSESHYQQLLETAAKTNNTTPEQIGKFFNEMVVEEI
jgi:hypothetical protein